MRIPSQSASHWLSYELGNDREEEDDYNVSYGCDEDFQNENESGEDDDE